MNAATETLALGKRYQQDGNLAHAELCYRQAIQVDPGQADALGALAGLYLATARFAEAASAFQDLLSRWPNWPEAHNDLGIALAEQGWLEEALQSFHEACRLRPDYPEAHNNAAVAYWMRGQCLDAAQSARRAIALRPDYPEAHNSLGNALREMDDFPAPGGCYEEALRLRPDYAEAHNNLGIALARQDRFEEAVASLRSAIALRPGYIKAHANLGNALLELGDVQAGLACYDAALRIDPHQPDAHRNRAIAWLRQGDFKRGWPEFEWRWLCADMPRRDFVQSRWQGQPLDQRAILLFAEQGLGDTIQFIRYAAPLQERGARVMVEAQAALLPLLAGCSGVDQLIAQGDPVPYFDFHLPLMSVPGVLLATGTQGPIAIPYLQADPQLVARWSREIRSQAGVRVGIAWHGSPSNPENARRSIPLRDFETLLHIPGIQLFSLQKGAGHDQLEAAKCLSIINLGPRLDEGAGAFMDTAAVMMSLDLIITCDTAVAHLAGALGVPVWVALPFLADWRWLGEGETSPWYPAMRLFRQSARGDWAGVFARIATALIAWWTGK